MLTTSHDTLKKNPGAIYHSAYSEILLTEVCCYGKLLTAKKFPQKKKKKVWQWRQNAMNIIVRWSLETGTEMLWEKTAGSKSSWELFQEKRLWKVLAYLCGACIWSRRCLNGEGTFMSILNYIYGAIGLIYEWNLKWHSWQLESEMMFCAISLRWMYCDLEVVVILSVWLFRTWISFFVSEWRTSCM